MTTAVLFDLDGTLLDTANDLGAALNFVLSKHGFPSVSEELFRPIASDGAKGLLELGFGERLAEFDFSELRQEFLDYYENNIATHTKLYDGIQELLTSLNNLNIPWGVITNKPIGLTLLLLPNYPIFTSSKVTLGGDSLPYRKPHPEPLLHAARAINIPSEQCIYVGDAPRDIESGNSANMHTAIASWGYISNLDDCQKWQANSMLSTPQDILALIKQ